MANWLQDPRMPMWKAGRSTHYGYSALFSILWASEHCSPDFSGSCKNCSWPGLCLFSPGTSSLADAVCLMQRCQVLYEGDNNSDHATINIMGLSLLLHKTPTSWFQQQNQTGSSFTTQAQFVELYDLLQSKISFELHDHIIKNWMMMIIYKREDFSKSMQVIITLWPFNA